VRYLALAPSAAQVRQTYQKVFPTMLGIRLAKRTDPDVLQRVIQDVQSIEKLEEGRTTVAIAQLADKLKSDFEKQYVAEFKEV
jgi:hypothetical protein